MTLSPVFRSAQAVNLLQQQGIWDRFSPALERQIEAVGVVHEDFKAVIDARYRQGAGAPIATEASDEDPGLKMLQDFFFLTLFLSLFEGLGVRAQRFPFYAELNFCIMGTITAADNLFDDQAKMLLPLRPVAGARYASILQLMCFERLLRRAGDRAVGRGLFAAESFERVQRGLLDQMAEIGVLEGSEEGGVGDNIPEPRTMVDGVHRVRGGKLFGLAFIAPKVLEEGAVRERMIHAEPAIAQLGTAFQIVDDLTDFEFDLGRKSHNLLVSQIYHHGTAGEKAKLAELWAGAPPAPGLVEGLFAESARAVLEMARREARDSFATLASLGFWFPPDLADPVVHAIVGLDGVARMEALAGNKE